MYDNYRPAGTLTVHFNDGHVESFDRVRFSKDADAPDPIEYKNGVLIIETLDQRLIRVYGARWSEFTEYEPPF